MRRIDKSLARAIASLERAKQRGKVTEIRAAALTVGRARQAAQRENARELERQAAKQRDQQARAERLANPQTPQERRSAAAAKGWATRRANQLERERGAVADQLPRAQRESPSGLTIFAVDDQGQIWPTVRDQLTDSEQFCADTILQAFQPGAEVFKVYTVASDEESARFWFGVIVWIDDNGEQKWAFTPRGLTRDEVMANVQGLAQRNSGGKDRTQVCAVFPVE